MTEQQIKHMVDRFLMWKLPENFNPDAGISFVPDYNVGTPYPMKHEPVGTNLFSANQADEMVRHMIDGMPSAMTEEPRVPTSVELLPCPFCGATDGRLVQAFTRATNDFAYWSVECLDCACEIASDASQDEADAAWNTRCPAPSTPALDEREGDLSLALTKLEAAATLVTEWLDRLNDRWRSSLGGPQWFELGRAIHAARSALASIRPGDAG